ncbi:LysR family transcriptional regulator ArgP [Roseivivax sp. CAU 1761]
MIDYAAARAVAEVVRTGSFERAAQALGVTSSAVSQRVRHLEERLGAVLILRGQPCTPTPKGQKLCRHMERVGLLESELLARLPELAPSGGARVTLTVATNADSLATWLMPALAAYAAEGSCLFNLAVDDEENTADWLRAGRVTAAVTAHARPVQGCRATPLGALRYRATASPGFVARHFPEGVTAAALKRAPALTFDRKDRLQQSWARRVFGRDLAFPTHWLPSTQAFLEGSLAGMGWALNPARLADPHIARGSLVDLAPGAPFDRPLVWQINRLADDQLAGLTREVRAAARAALEPA